MKTILVTGALGQIGSELVMHLRKTYGGSNVIASDVVKKDMPEVLESGPFEQLNVLEPQKVADVCKKYKVDTVIHLAALLSAVAERDPQMAFNINIHGLYNMLEIARENKYRFFVPSSIAAFGPGTPQDKTPQDTIQRPTSMYGVTKVSGVRFPGLISYTTLPGGGTTDYAVDIYYEALKNKKYECFIKEGTYMDMMYMPDALKAVQQLLETDESKLIHRNAFNIASMSFTPEIIAAEIKKHIPEFQMTYKVDPMRQAIADSWPNSIDDTCARNEWNWKPEYTLETMTVDMLEKLSKRLGVAYQSVQK